MPGKNSGKVRVKEKLLSDLGLNSCNSGKMEGSTSSKGKHAGGNVHLDVNEMDWEGFEHFMELQAHEEYEHAEYFKKWLQEVGYKVEYGKIDAPTVNYEKDVLSIFMSIFNKFPLVRSLIYYTLSNLSPLTLNDM